MTNEAARLRIPDAERERVARARLRVATAERELGDALRELNEALGPFYAPVPELAAPPPARTKPREPTERLPPAPDAEPSDLDKKLAEKTLAKLGYSVR